MISVHVNANKKVCNCLFKAFLIQLDAVEKFSTVYEMGPKLRDTAEFLGSRIRSPISGGGANLKDDVYFTDKYIESWV